jgi:hypothetical protein
VIGGKVLDPSALAAQAQGSIAMQTWLAVTVPTGLVLYLPELVAAETQAVYPGNERLGTTQPTSPTCITADFCPPAP